MSDAPEVRIGTAERDRALNELSTHFAAGRLTVAEFDERSAQVTHARTRGDLDKLFTDLPSDAPARMSGERPARTDGERTWRRTAVAVMPLVALALFFTVPIDHAWLFFLLIPLSGTLLHGGHRRHR
ncbi:DUF1707 domain-containing protein [Rhodococcus sp. HNM0569]|uniref:DUF1707 SHOCT-like domain-containing protein n=1 Tax=Rhodococcus sp. HNM0569 TaxID=2716340 RepID=UPI00146D9416|nr:DUF1707 domain-containing protein [Rhodococcus sp. HNM0569]NLU81881.1 DUF1707 domain-containing protein [Rhodococcus sp. HNM0569]